MSIATRTRTTCHGPQSEFDGFWLEGFRCLSPILLKFKPNNFLD
jgi:hypothetical protein